MSFSVRTVCLCAAATAVVAILSGCSAHQNHPMTPVDSAKTPTFRSSTNSYDQPNSPLYTQPGINTGTKSSLPSLPPSTKFNQNAPLALAVYGQLQSRMGANDIRYMTLQSKGDTVLLSGTAQSAAIARAARSIAAKTAGVHTVIDYIKVQP